MWVYPLFYVHGSQAWHKNLKKTNGRKLTRLNYVRYRLANREGQFNPFLLGRRLSQQYVTDSQVKIERDRIEWCKNNQNQLKKESYQGLIDYLSRRSEGSNTQIGKITILPSTFEGSPRNMVQKYQDSMAIAAKFGKPDLFITMTCNPNWEEIRENLQPGETALDRPTLVSTVFNLKVKALIEYLKTSKCFGEILAYICSTEFQKRGLPHIHLLLMLAQNSKFRNTRDIDKIVSATIPDPLENPVLHERVIKHMIHGPCGDWCLVNNKCSKNYPKSFNEETTIDGNDRVQYKRPNDGKSYEKSHNFKVDNRNVVPYPPLLMMLFNCHINVEFVFSNRSIKYLFKYILKGHDAAAIRITSSENDGSREHGEQSSFDPEVRDNEVRPLLNHDEISTYIESRYVSPAEAAWRILSLPTYNRSHPVYRLPVHLPNHQSIVIHTDPENIDLESAAAQSTMLIDYFALNQRDPQARNYYYVEIPQYYTFLKRKNVEDDVAQWRKRKGSFNCLGRIYSVSPSNPELFHLRLLLTRVKGATSFESLKTVDGTICESFQAACLARGLIENDEEWKRALQESSFWMMPKQLRRLFVRLLIFCTPVDPLSLWDEFKQKMSKDFIRSSDSELHAEKKTYVSLHKMLQYYNKHINDYFSIPEYNINFDIFHDINNENFGEEQLQNMLKKGKSQYSKMNNEQKNIVDEILNSLNHGNDNRATTQSTNKCIFIDGPARTGKLIYMIHDSIY